MNKKKTLFLLKVIRKEKDIQKRQIEAMRKALIMIENNNISVAKIFLDIEIKAHNQRNKEFVTKLNQFFIDAGEQPLTNYFE